MVSPSKGPSRLSSGLSNSDGGQGSTSSASGENSAQTSWQGQGPGSRASSAQSSLQGLSVNNCFKPRFSLVLRSPSVDLVWL